MVTIHEKTAQIFNTLGLGALLPAYCIVTEELNGAFELEMEHPYDADGKWKRIEEGRILYASTPRGRQPFRIYRTRPDMEGITVNARHIFYDLLDNQCSPVSFNGTASGALDALQGAFAYAMPFSFDTDISISGTITTGRMNPVQAILSDDDETTSFIKGFGGEVLRDGFNVSIKTSMGQDRDVAIRYGKNLIGLEVTQDESDVKTRIQCYGKNGSATVDSPYLGAYLYPKIHTLEDENKTVAELQEEAQALLDGGIDIPMVNIKVDFIPLSKTVEYKNYAVLEDVQLGDIVTVIHNKMNFSKRARVISYEWDCILEQYNEVELGDFMPTLASSVTSGVRSVSLASNASVTASAVSAALQSHMNDKNNPHNVTAEQTGGSSGGGTSDVQEELNTHIKNKNNPHGVTAGQVGAYTKQEVDSKLQNLPSGGAAILYGAAEPNDSNGKDGDLYVRMGKKDGNTLLLLHGENFFDSGEQSVAITNNGVSVSEVQSKFGGKSLYFDGTANIQMPSSTFDFGSGNFTIDWWEYAESGAGTRFCTQFGKAQTGMSIGNNGTQVNINSNYATTGWDVVGAWGILDVTVGQWVHWALVRSGNTLTVYKNGVNVGTKPITATLVIDLTRNAAIGTNPGNNNGFKGYIDEFRVSNVARWTADFTPQTEPYADESALYIKINGTWTLAMKGAE